MDRFAWERALSVSSEPPWAKYAGLMLAIHYPAIRPGWERLGLEMGVHPDTARKAVKRLERDGWLQKAGGGSGPGRGRVGASGIAILWDLAIPETSGADARSFAGCSEKNIGR